jgi:multidrug efflux system outer membrane protein
MRFTLLGMTLAVAAMAGCMTVGPDYHRPVVETPEQWPGAATGPAVSATWWQAYGDPVLNRMVDEALQHNLDLRVAIARVEEARSALGITRADQYPTVTAGVAASRNRISQESVISVPPGVDPKYNDYRVTLNASYEIDFWGKYRRATEAARAELLASTLNREAVRLTLISDTAKGYFALRALDAQVAITRRTLSTRQASTALQRLRFEAGVASEFDLRQVEAETAQAQALLPSIEQRLAAQETALSVLLGRSPRAIAAQPMDRGSALEALTAPPSIPAGLPSEILERRPDLRQAEQVLVAANARIGQARAAYYPSISLTGFFGTESSVLSGLFEPQARMWQFAGAAAQTVFDAGRTKSQVGVAEARQQQALAQYQSAIQNAFRDTLDALVAQRKAREVMEAEQRRIEALNSAMRLAQLRYDNGVASFLELLIAERALLDAQLNQVDAQRAQLSATADLFKAMGGGWDGDGLPDPGKSATSN